MNRRSSSANATPTVCSKADANANASRSDNEPPTRTNQIPRKEEVMNLDSFSDEDVVLMARALSIHRVSMRRKLDRLRPGTPEFRATVDEIDRTQDIVTKLNQADMQRVSAA